MALTKKTIIVTLLVFLGVLTTAAVSLQVSRKLSVTPNAPQSQPLACDEECPGEDGVLRSCTPPEPGGGSVDSRCLWAGRLEKCGGVDYCCPEANGEWTTDTTYCAACEITPPSSPSVQKLSSTSVKLKWTPGEGGVTRLWVSKNSNPTGNCGTKTGGDPTCIVDDKRFEPDIEEYLLDTLKPNTKYYWRIMTWKVAGCDSGLDVKNFTTDPATTCTDTSWTPNVNTVCSGTSLIQTSNCDATRSATGTKTDGACTACVDGTWTPNVNTVCSGSSLTQTSNCGTTRTAAGTKTDGVCVVCTDTTWTPSTANTCSDRKMNQTSNCGNTREVSGTKTCYPNLSISTNTYQDDPRNKPGVYFTDKKISKVSRDQFMVYTMEVKNTGEGGAANFEITDTLTGQNQTLISFVDNEERCTFDNPTKRLTCKISNLVSNGAEKIKFRVKVAQTALNGKVIRNTAKVTYGNNTKSGSIDTLVSSIVNCNEFCNSDSECIAGLACDVFSNKCRKPTCSKETSCTCAVATATPTKTPTITKAATPTDSSVDFPDSSTTTLTPTFQTTPPDSDSEIIAIDEVEELPETGIFDLPQTAVFGGGILLAVLGLFLAL